MVLWINRFCSALATSVAITALAIVDSEKHRTLIEAGLSWLTENQNQDGGWGDSNLSKTNLSATLLTWSAFMITEDSFRYKKVISKAKDWLNERIGSLKPSDIAKALNDKYGEDKTFSVPILTMCALAGVLGPGNKKWALIKPLPFELAALPHQWFKTFKLSVVSYAMPALIAMGYVHFCHYKPSNLFRRLLRKILRRTTLKVLQNIQPANGGFLEAPPLTGYVVMALAASGEKNSFVVSKAVKFLMDSARKDGSWPIDTNLATWVTTLSVNAMAVDDNFQKDFSSDKRRQITDWLLTQQYKIEHPYTHAAPGGWGWTDKPGAVPDADDTPGALIALKNLAPIDDRITQAVENGINWILDLQNPDGGIPTFCRGWSKLPFDKSTADLTAHSIIAMDLWRDSLPSRVQNRTNRAIEKAVDYLQQNQTDNGSWIPLWFGNQHAPHQQNPIYGTAKVLNALTSLPLEYTDSTAAMIMKSSRWIVSAQNNDGGWGAEKSVQSSVEETALAIDALAQLLYRSAIEHDFDKQLYLATEQITNAISRAASWLNNKIKSNIYAVGKPLTPTPIGLYFASLWYYEDLYPYIFALSALQKVKKLFDV